MKTLKININDTEFIEYNFSGEQISFKELEIKVISKFGKKALEDVVRVSEETGLTK